MASQMLSAGSYPFMALHTKQVKRDEEKTDFEAF